MGNPRLHGELGPTLALSDEALARLCIRVAPACGAAQDRAPALRLCGGSSAANAGTRSAGARAW
jgi:hypothetical protein